MWEKMYIVAYNNCLKRSICRRKYCLNRVVYGWVNLPTSGTLMHDARITAYKNTVTCSCHNVSVRFIFTVFDGREHVS